jgi:hypothetical protein
VLLALAICAAGCGDERAVRVVTPETVQPRDLARYPAGSPQRSTLELLRAVQLNNPGAAARNLSQASFELSREAVTRSLGNLRTAALAVGVPPRLTVIHRGPSTALVTAGAGKSVVTLRWTRAGASWQLTGIGARSGTLARRITTLIFLARHPELDERAALRERGLLGEWYSLWLRIRALGR